MTHASRGRSLCWVAVAYVVAFVLAACTFTVLPDYALWMRLAAADLVATIVVFAFSRAFDNSSFYDAYWSVWPLIATAGLAILAAPSDVPLARRALVLVAVTTWGVRLTANWVRGWSGLSHEDWRYVDLRSKTGNKYWLASFFGLHLMPTVIVFVASLPILVALTEGAHPVGPLDAVAVVVCLGATALEAVADEQLRTFRKTCTDPKRIHDTGLWGVVRHPNYLGEMLFWWGVYLFALAADLGAWWTGIGALLVTCLFLFASIPLIETRMRARRPGWDDHVRRVPALLPWPRRT